jgi:hypothetical protein
MDQILWAPPLPSNGRSGPRIALSNPSLSFGERLKEYYLGTEFRGGLTRWTRLPRRALRNAGLDPRSTPGNFKSYSRDEQIAIFLGNLYFKASANLIRQLQKASCPWSTAQRWLDTADGVVLPYLLEAEEPDVEVCDQLARFALEGCANNYPKFIARLKSRKKEIRKCLALDEEIPFRRDTNTFTKVYLSTRPKVPHKWPCSAEDLHAHGVHTQVWCQTRGTGMADMAMAAASQTKFEGTVTLKDIPREDFMFLEHEVRNATRCVRSMRGIHAHISAGPKASLGMRQGDGGHTAMLSHIVRSRRVQYRYDPVTLERVEDWRRVKTSSDVLDHCITWVLENQVLRRLVKPHVVLEPSKARVITISPWEVSRLQGVVAHLIAPCLRHSFRTKSGMTKDRHLWRFFKNLHPQDTNWQHAMGQPVLSTDWSEATDFFSHRFAKQIWYEILRHLKDIPGVPLGLIRLAATLHTETRIVLDDSARGPGDDDETKNISTEKYILTSRGLFMGDYLTKAILTFAQDACARAAGLRVYSIVGDDFIAFGDRPQLLQYLDFVRRTGGRISEEDTYISERYMYYCEEMAVVPWTTPNLPVIQYRKGSSWMNYLDCPRIRLILPVTAETQGFSDTSIGKFSLLGKESRWVASTHTGLRPLFERASLLQHILLPQDRDTLSAFLPVEIGGDGGFIEDPSFLSRVTDHCRDPVEARYRLTELYRGRVGFRYVRSDTLNQVLHRHTMKLPVIDKLRQYLPEELVIDIDESNSSLRSIQVRGLLENPEQTILRMVKESYYRKILQGFEIDQIDTNPWGDLTKRHAMRGSNPPYVPFRAFLEHWKCPGFRFENHASFLVRADLAPMIDHLSLAWDFGQERPQRTDEIFRDWLSQSGCLEDTQKWDLLDNLIARKDLPEAVRARLHMFIESDSVVKESFCRDLPADGTQILLVSTDQNLGADLVRLGEARGMKYQVLCLRPAFYLYGRLEEIPEALECSVTIEDPGSMFYEDSAHFSEGDAPEWIMDPIVVRDSYRRKGVRVADRQSAKLRNRFVS